MRMSKAAMAALSVSEVSALTIGACVGGTQGTKMVTGATRMITLNTCSPTLPVAVSLSVISTTPSLTLAACEIACADAPTCVGGTFTGSVTVAGAVLTQSSCVLLADSVTVLAGIALLAGQTEGELFIVATPASSSSSSAAAASSSSAAAASSSSAAAGSSSSSAAAASSSSAAAASSSSAAAASSSSATPVSSSASPASSSAAPSATACPVGPSFPALPPPFVYLPTKAGCKVFIARRNALARMKRQVLTSFDDCVNQCAITNGCTLAIFNRVKGTCTLSVFNCQCFPRHSDVGILVGTTSAVSIPPCLFTLKECKAKHHKKPYPKKDEHKGKKDSKPYYPNKGHKVEKKPAPYKEDKKPEPYQPEPYKPEPKKYEQKEHKKEETYKQDPPKEYADGGDDRTDRCGSQFGGDSCDQGECCSPYGWCGKSDSHCGSGCQKEFGKCW